MCMIGLWFDFLLLGMSISCQDDDDDRFKFYSLFPIFASFYMYIFLWLSNEMKWWMNLLLLLLNWFWRSFFYTEFRQVSLKFSVVVVWLPSTGNQTTTTKKKLEKIKEWKCEMYLVVLLGWLVGCWKFFSFFLFRVWRRQMILPCCCCCCCCIFPILFAFLSYLCVRVLCVSTLISN